MSENHRMIVLPGWMEAKATEPARGARWSKSRPNFLGKSIRHMKQALADELRSEHYASQDGWLQKMDPRSKLFAAVLFIILTGLIRSIPLMLGLWVFTLLLMLVSKLPVGKLQRRIWGFIPMLTLLMSIPAMFNIIIDGVPLLMIHHNPTPTLWLGIHIPADIFISQQGFIAGLYLFIRVGLSLSMGVLLTATTPAASLLKSLRVMGIPPLVVMIIEMSYRYLVLLLGLSIEMFEARDLRTVGVLSLGARRAQVGSSLAALFVRSMDLADEVYLAMTARGYTGQSVSMDGKRN